MSVRLLSRRSLIRLACVLCTIFALEAAAETRVVKPTGAYAQIDTHQTDEAIQRLTSGSPAEKSAAIAAIQGSPQSYAPPALYLLSNVLFSMGEKDDAAFWFYAGQLRARFDANRCADASARQAVAALNQEYGKPINQYTFQDITKLEALIPRVVEWDRTTAHEYDHRWINLHGMSAMLSGLGAPDGSPVTFSLPESEWAAIADRTRAEYLDGFQHAMAQMKSMKR